MENDRRMILDRESCCKMIFDKENICAVMII